MRFVGGRRNTFRNCRRIELVPGTSIRRHLTRRSEKRSSQLSNELFSPQMTRVFLLSPAFAGGQRAQMILSERAQFDLARRLKSEEPPTLGEVFTFLSGLYFRGKLAYANAFTHPTARTSRVLVITPNR